MTIALAAGVPGLQLTWMDARVEGREVTPRIGKPIELQALWIRALELTGGNRTVPVIFEEGKPVPVGWMGRGCAV